MYNVCNLQSSLWNNLAKELKNEEKLKNNISYLCVTYT